MFVIRHRHTEAFSLVELSIVLVILGLLVGGVLGGQMLIRAAEIRSISTQATEIKIAANSFRDKYRALPGDMRKAEDLWGTDPDGCPTHANRVPKKETCNGNQDGKILANTEGFRAWQHLANAGMIQGSYTGVTGPSNVRDQDPGINVFQAKIAHNAGFGLDYMPLVTGNGYLFERRYGNYLVFGACATWDCILPILTPGEMWSIDTKLDDGAPGTGNIITRANGVSGHPECVNGGPTEASIATYKLDNDVVACAFYYLNYMD